MANDVYQLTMIGTCAGEFWETVQHWQSGVAASADPVGTADALITAFIATPQGTLLDCMAADTFVSGYKCKRVNNGGSPTVLHPQTPVAGTEAGTSATSGTAMCIVSWFQHTIGSVTKFKTGRWFLPGVPESQLVGNHLTAGHISALATFIADFGTISASPHTFTYGTWSTKFDLFFTPTYIAPSNKIGIQRRRLLPVL